jgi:ABC-type multidrug transport system fused ATPase/permease subunit
VRESFDETTEISSADTIRFLRRALRYIEPFRARFAIKFGYGVVCLIPMLLLPWPVKVLVDNAIEGIPVGESLTPLPPFIAPLVGMLADASPWGLILWPVGFQMLLLFLVGAIGTGGRETDHADAYLASGHDEATRTENEANAGFSLAGGLLGYFDFRFTIRLTQALNHHYRSQLFERIQSLPMGAFDDERIGDALYRVMYDTPSITNGCFRIILTPALAALGILFSVGMLHAVFGAHPGIVWAGLALLPLSLFGTLPFAAAIRRRGASSRKAGATTTATMEEGFSNILAVQSMGGEGRERERFDRDSWESFSQHREVFRTGIVAALTVFIPALLIFGWAFLYAVDLVIEGHISRGDFGLFITYFSIIAGASIEVGALWFRMQTSAAGLHRVFFLMDMPSEPDSDGSEQLQDVSQGIRLDDVSFEFDDGTRAVRGVDLEIPLGKFTALVGPAGAGKTTLAYLACGYHTPSAGSVTIDGRDLRSFTRESLRSNIAFVFQETALFDGTVEDNIKLGRPDASEVDVRRAARTAGADEFIQRLPDGYRTQLGRSGGKLSVGQKQRLSIARALVREAPVLVLDEPTSALDAETERTLVEAMHEAARTRVVLVIAHRLSSVRSADQIVFVDAGQVVERGTHEELMRSERGAYRRFVELQTQGAA